MLRKYCFVALMTGLVLALFSCTKRKPEVVDYAPNSPFNPYPPDSAANIDHTTLDVTLRWTVTDPNAGEALTYSIYLDTLNPPLIPIASGLSSPGYFLTGLSYNTTYYWKLYITDDKGAITSGPVWRFTTLPHANTAPSVPFYLFPADNASWQYPTLTFDWNCFDPEGDSDTLHFDLYLGVTPEPPIRLFSYDTASLREMSGLNYAATYYWKIVAHDNHEAYSSGLLFSFSTRDCPWFYKREMPTPRYGFGTAVVSGKIYVIGGISGGSYISEVLEYDPQLDSWSPKTNLPTPRSNLAITAWDGKIYAIGGQSSDGVFRTTEVYDPLYDDWETLAPSPEPHHSITAHAVNGKIYTLGGEATDGLTWGGVFEYDIAKNAWWDTTAIVPPDTFHYHAKSLMPSYRYAVCSALYNGDIYIFSGSPLNSYPVSTVDIYHPETNAWTSAAPMIGPANFPAAVESNGYIYVLGGYGHEYLRRVRKYDPITDTWFVRGDMLDYRSAFGAAFINNRIYAFGGTGLFPLGTLEEYRIELDPKNNGR